MPAKPSLDLLRALSDEHVLRALMTRERATRAELAAGTGLSKPTVSESVRRLTELGVVVDSGERSSGRGRSGAYYRLADDAGTALAVSIAPEGMTAEVVDAHGATVARAEDSMPRPSRADVVARQLRDLVEQVVETKPRLAVVSAADPVDRVSGRLVHLPDAPFLIGALDPVEVLAPFVVGPVVVDNDVNWAARAERDLDGELRDFVLLHLGEGLGAAVVTDGEVHRGHGGLAGEIAHIITEGPSGKAMRFIEVFAELGLRQPHSTAIDVETLQTSIRDAEPAAQNNAAPTVQPTAHNSTARNSAARTSPSTAGDRGAGETRAVLARAVTGVVAAVSALADPQVVIVGGAWGPLLVPAVEAELARHPRPVPLRPAAAPGDPSFTGARAQALTDLQNLVARPTRADHPH